MELGVLTNGGFWERRLEEVSTLHEYSYSIMLPSSSHVLVSCNCFERRSGNHAVD